MQRAIDILAIKVPKTYSGGTYLSDFDVEDTESGDAPPDSPPEDVPEEAPEESLEPVPRLYANQRGRRAAVRDVLDLVAAFSAGLLSVKDVIIRNTLFPYYSRFSSFGKKTAMLEQLCRGETIVITSIRKFAAKSVPWYCPQCVAEDRSAYGEAYWHIEHQIPLMMLCSKHGCLLQTADDIIPSHIDYTFYPLESVYSERNPPVSSRILLPGK